MGSFLMSAVVHTGIELRLPGLVSFLGLAAITAIAYWLDGVPPSISAYSVWGLLLLGGFFCGAGIFLLFWTTWYAILAGLLSISLGLRYFGMLTDTEGGVMMVRDTSKDSCCDCACHRGQTKHAAPCCCVHRIKLRRKCAQCDKSGALSKTGQDDGERK